MSRNPEVSATGRQFMPRSVSSTISATRGGKRRAAAAAVASECLRPSCHRLFARPTRRDPVSSRFSLLALFVDPRLSTLGIASESENQRHGTGTVHAALECRQDGAVCPRNRQLPNEARTCTTPVSPVHPFVCHCTALRIPLFFFFFFAGSGSRIRACVPPEVPYLYIPYNTHT